MENKKVNESLVVNVKEILKNNNKEDFVNLRKDILTSKKDEILFENFNDSNNKYKIINLNNESYLDRNNHFNESQENLKETSILETNEKNFNNNTLIYSIDSTKKNFEFFDINYKSENDSSKIIRNNIGNLDNDEINIQNLIPKNLKEVSKITIDDNLKHDNCQSELNANFTSENFKIDNHLDKIGYSYFHLRMLFILSLIFFVDGCEISNLNLLLSSIQNDLNLSTFQKSILNSSIFMGILIGSFLSGFTTNKYGRLKPIKYGIFFIFIFSFLTSISKSISQLIIMRILSGLAIGTVIPACKTLITESIPSKSRSLVFSIVFILYPLGTVYICILSLNFVEGKDFNWRKIFMINSLSSFFLIILSQFLYESPRYLLKKGKSHEAIEILDLMGNWNRDHKKVKLNEEEKIMILNEAWIIKEEQVEERIDNCII